MIEDRRYLPTRVGYECAAFARYFVPFGADQSKRIEEMPSSQWGVQSDEAAAYLSPRAIALGNRR